VVFVFIHCYENLLDYNSCVSNKFIILLALSMFCTSCGEPTSQNDVTTPTVQVITATLAPPSPPVLSETPPAQFPQSTELPTVIPVAPVEGITSTQLNVRADPSTASEVLGIIPANTVVQIVGKDPGENWWQILYLEAGQANEGKGWVTAQYVTVTDTAQVPVIGGSGSNPNNPNAAVIQQQLNVRSGPGTSFNSLGTLNPQDVVALTGKDANGAWLQIEYSAGPKGRGWINAAFAQAQGVENLPIVSDVGQVIGTGTPVDTPLPPTPTVVPAPIDNDSAQTPAVDVAFRASGTHALQFSSDVSSPTGDPEDWIQFTPFTARVIIELTCTGSGLVTAELSQNSQSVPGWERLTCGARSILTTETGISYQLHVRSAASERLQYTQFMLTITSLP
jgi:uncharacterized protein YgiM (DUF1202 family)